MSRDVFTPQALDQENAEPGTEQFQQPTPEVAAADFDAIERFANSTNPEAAAGRHAINQSYIQDGVVAAEQHANTATGTVTTEIFDMRYFTTPEGHRHVSDAMMQLNKAVLHARAAEQGE